jgi:transketolase
MRNHIIEEIYNYMKEDENIYFLTGDLGFNVVENLQESFPARFINVGIAEQNMIGIAAGLAMSGKKVYAYSIIPFITMRCFEQIRDDLCFHDLDVTLLGAGSGLSYGILSSTHFALEDVAILRTLPNLTIFSPADATEAVLGLKKLRTHGHPTYIRIGKKQEPIVYEKDFPFSLGRMEVIHEGSELAIISTGSMVYEAMKALKLLKNIKNIDAGLYDMHTIKPLDTQGLGKIAKQYSYFVTVEEHGLIGGLGSAIVEFLADEGIQIPVLRIGVANKHVKEVGTQEYLRSVLGLDADSITKKIISQVSK